MSQGSAPKKRAASKNDDEGGSDPARFHGDRRRPGSRDAASGDYTVVARRYRPQRFEDVVGQDHVVQALRNAIRLNRVAQAYLFSGTRGVGKTSMARIFAKCLNCVNGPTETPCNESATSARRSPSARTSTSSRSTGPATTASRQVRELRQNAGAPAQPGPVQDLLHRRSPHALDRGLQRPVEDAGRAARRTSSSSSRRPSRTRSRSPSSRAASGTTSPGSRPEQIVEPLAEHLRPARGSRPTARRSRSSPDAPAGRCATPSRCWNSSCRRAARADRRGGPRPARDRQRRPGARPARRPGRPRPGRGARRCSTRRSARGCSRPTCWPARSSSSAT